jgi:rfaE bifunctional protein kinase chain/domain
MELFKKYNHKVVTESKLKKLLRKNKNTTVMCHGVFDVVHPGHVRHLVHAKSKADILIVSITADKFIKKGIYRPHVPERLRALNLSAFESVDYVVINQSKTSKNIIKSMKPNYFAKGFEYSSKNMPIATRDEVNLLKTYGGKMLFTPGDYVYSSSKFLEYKLPKITYEKLQLLLSTFNLNFSKIKNSLKDYNNIKVHIIGDTIVDTHTITNFIGGQTKTPTFSLHKLSEKNYIGGAAIVALHLKEAGAKVTFTTVLGKDNLSKFVLKKLKDKKIKLNIFNENNRPTTNKNSMIAGGYRLLKLDTLNNMPILSETVEGILKKIKSANSDIVILSDFRHGIFNQYSLNKILKAIPKKTFKVADSQVASRWGNIIDFKYFDLITPNEREARFSLGDQDSVIGSLAGDLINQSKAKNLILKLSEKGIFSISKITGNKQSYFSLDSFCTNLIDGVGAGDALLAYSALTLFKTRSLLISSIIGSLAAACECEVDGNIPVNIKKINEKLKDLEKNLTND